MDGSAGVALGQALGELRVLLGERLSTAAALREQHGRGEAHLPPSPPDAVAFARSAEDVAGVISGLTGTQGDAVARQMTMLADPPG